MIHPSNGQKVRALKVKAKDLGSTNTKEETPGSGRWRKSLLERAWVALRRTQGEIEVRLPKPDEARKKPSSQEGWWVLERGNIVWIKQPQQKIVGGVPHTWPAGWYRLTKIAGNGEQLTFEPCDHPLPYRVVKKNGKEKKEYADLTLTGNDLIKLRWPRSLPQ